MRKNWPDTTQYISDAFPYQIDLEYLEEVKACEWIKQETSWANLVLGFTIEEPQSIVMYDLHDNADYAIWMLKFNGQPPSFRFREEKHAIWFKLHWV